MGTDGTDSSLRMGSGLGWGQMGLAATSGWARDWGGDRTVMGTDGIDSNPRMGLGSAWGQDWDKESPEGHRFRVEAGIGMHFLLSLPNPGLLSEAGKGPQMTGAPWRCPSAEIPGGNILAEPFGNRVFPKTPSLLPNFPLSQK